MKYQWTLDTPWAKKGDTVEIADYWLHYHHLAEQKLLDLGWIKPVEEKRDGNFVCGYSPEVNKTEKLTAEEILEQISYPFGHGGISPNRLALFLAEHLN